MNEKKCRQLVRARADGLCERCGRQGHTFHHRKNRSAGGGWDCANIVFLCGDGVRGCHGWVTSHPLEASLEGFHVKPWQEPVDIPILLHGRLSRRLTWDTSDYDITQQQVDEAPPERETGNERTSPDHHRWNFDW